VSRWYLKMQHDLKGEGAVVCLREHSLQQV
jgi:hypothetical protein